MEGLLKPEDGSKSKSNSRDTSSGKPATAETPASDSRGARSTNDAGANPMSYQNNNNF